MEEGNFTDEQIKDIVNNMPKFGVYSSNLTAIGYEETRKILYVTFRNGGRYIYYNVEPEIFNALKVSESKGKTLNEMVVRHKDKYKYKKLI